MITLLKLIKLKISMENIGRRLRVSVQPLEVGVRVGGL